MGKIIMAGLQAGSGFPRISRQGTLKAAVAAACGMSCMAVAAPGPLWSAQAATVDGPMSGPAAATDGATTGASTIGSSGHGRRRPSRAVVNDASADERACQEQGTTNLAGPSSSPLPVLPLPPQCSPRLAAVITHLEEHPPDLFPDTGGMPMYYEPTRELSAMHLPDVVRGLTADEVLPVPPSTRQEVVAGDGGSGAVAMGGSAAAAASRQHFARVVAALAYVATGGLDHAHNLVGRASQGSMPFN